MWTVLAGNQHREPSAAQQRAEREGEDTDPFTNTVTVTIGRLRRKLGTPPIITTTPGAGYRIT